jgi:probable HAF family extracellular repeat protein
MRHHFRTLMVTALCGAFASPAANAAPEYSVSNLAAFGGTRNQGNSINNDGLVSGFTSRPGDLHRHATAWVSGQPYDLGTLGGPNSNVAWPVKNTSGRIIGISQTNAPEPLGERWSCAGFFQTDATGYICRGAVWENGGMRALPTLGGNNGYAAGGNNRGEITGWAETAVFDPSCEGPGPGKSGQVLQFLPVVYGPGADAIRALPLIAGDSSGAATAINDHGQAVGISGSCDQAVGRYTAAHAVLWDRNGVTDIGQGVLPAPFWNTPTAISNRGDVVGFAGDPSDPTAGITHAFIWTRDGGMQLLNPAADDNSTATGINAQRQVVGYFVAGDGTLHGFVWDRSQGMRDLNDLKQPDYGAVIALANDINDDGVITGRTATSNGIRSAIVAIPLSTP